MKKAWFKNWYAKHFGVKDISDDYTNFLSSIIVGFLHKGNLYCMDYAICHMPPNTSIVEIGSYAGLSTAVLTRYAKLCDADTKIFSCDIWQFDFMKEYISCGKYVKDMFIRNMKLLTQQLPITVEMQSNDFFKLWREHRKIKDVFGRKLRLGGDIGFAYIDGCHKYEVAIQDFYDVDQSLVVGGFILCDDTGEGSELYGTGFVKNILATGRYELVIGNPNALFKKTK